MLNLIRLSSGKGDLMSNRANSRRGAWFAALAYTLFVGAGCAALIGEAAPTPEPTLAADPSPAFAVLVFSRTTGFRHASIPAGIAALRELGAAHGFSVEATEDSSRFSDTGLAPFQVVVFLNTTGDVLDADQEAAFERFIRAGKGFVGIHSASDTEYDWAWYGGLVGAYFADHPAIQPAELDVLRNDHPATAGLPARWARTDEWYNFRAPLADDIAVLITVDETTYNGGTMGAGHPISWYHAYDGGRAFYTALGHTEESYVEQLFRAHLAGAVRWAAGSDQRVALPLLGG
jgi:type 1 glutamine amidotransferase